MVFLGVNGVLIGPRTGMEDKGLPPHKAQDQGQKEKRHHQIADYLHKAGGPPGKGFVDKFLHQLHIKSPHGYDTTRVYYCQ